MDIVDNINKKLKARFINNIEISLRNEELFEIFKIKHHKMVHMYFETKRTPKVFVNKKGRLVECL